MSDTSSATGRQQSPLLSRRAGVVRTLGLNIVGPLVVYYLCRNAGIPDVWALVVAGTLPALGVLLDWLRWRRFEVLGAVVLGIGVVSIGLALVTADAKVVLLQNPVWFGVLGLAFLVSLLWRRPLHFYFSQAFFGGRHSVTVLPWRRSTIATSRLASRGERPIRYGESRVCSWRSGWPLLYRTRPPLQQ